MHTSEREAIETRLLSRDVDPSRTHVALDRENDVAVFLLYNLSGRLVGYQQYNPRGTKVGNEARDREKAKYWKYVTKHPDPTIGVCGFESVLMHQSFLFVTEGIFDAVKLHNAGMPAVAALGNHPKALAPWFVAMHKTIIAVADNDEAGQKLRTLASLSISTPEPYKDLGEMPQVEVLPWLHQELPTLLGS